MLTTIHITVRERVPTITAGEDVISHNSDYVAEFEFDEEWQDKVKTVYFVCEDGSYQAVVMNGDSCSVPMLDGEHRRIFVGVQAGAAEKPSVLKTTRPCCLKVKDSIADYLGEQIPDPTPDVYEQIIAMLESITSPTWDAVQNKPFSTLGSGLSVDENGVLSAKGGVELSQKAEVGEVLTVEEVDENGKPTKWKTAPAAAEQVQSDWGQNGETAADFVKNRPGGYMVEQEQSITLQAYDQMSIDGVIEAKPNDIITLNIDGVSNSYKVKSLGESGALYIGDSPIEEPTIGFTIIFVMGSITIFNNDVSAEAEHTYKFKCKVPKKFPKEYLPNEVFEIEFNNWYSPENRLDDEEMSRLKKLRLYARKQSGGYDTNIAVSPDGSLYLTKTFIAKKTLPAIEFNSNLNSQDISVAKNDLKVGDFVVLQINDTVTKHNTCIVFPPIDAASNPSYPSNDMQTVAYINNKLFAITVTGVYVNGSMKNTTINIKKIL